MSLDFIANNPRRIKDIKEVKEALKRIDSYKKRFVRNDDDVGVLVIQNMQIGALYKIK